MGECIGICKYDSSNVIRKARKCSSVALKESPADVAEEDAKVFLDSLKWLNISINKIIKIFI